jgi:outer membrane receptor protein involved in Fe transport
MNLFQNFTYFLDDPVDGDQFEQMDRRTVTGGRLSYRRLGHLGEIHTESAFGVQLRHDSIDTVGLFKTVARQRRSTTRLDTVSQTSVGIFAQSEVEWSRTLRTTVGLRGDVYGYDVSSDNPQNSGTASDAILSPKLTTVLGPWADTELYASAGLGFHSNHGLGVTLAVDPKTGAPADSVPPLVRARGAEVGLRTIRIPGLQSTVALWVLDFDSELLFVGDTGSTEASRPSRRYGIEWTNYAHPRDWLTLDLDVSLSRSRFTDDDPAGDAIPGALSRVIGGGVTIDHPRGWLGTLRLRHFGPRALVEDESVTSAQTALFNGEAGYRLTAQVRLMLEVFNLFNASVADIDYYYTSRLPDEPVDGIDDIHTHPALPRSARLVLRVDF